MSFHVGPVPAEYQLAYQPYLFNTKHHRALQHHSTWKEFHWLDNTSKSVLISIYFSIEDGLAKSPFRAPFGGFECSDSVRPEALINFIASLEKALARDNVRAIEILCPPELYSKNQSLFTTLLVNQGYDIVLAEPGACIVVDDAPLANKMTKDKRARLKQCINAGLTFKKISLIKLGEVYTFIESCRSKQERKLSMALAEILKTVATLPESFFIVGVFDKKKMVGACICVRVNASIVYTFYSAHDAAYDAISPRVFLLSNLYEWCAQHKITLLDLGTSALDDRPNFPLLDFKLRVGATRTHKFKFRKTLA